MFTFKEYPLCFRFAFGSQTKDGLPYRQGNVQELSKSFGGDPLCELLLQVVSTQPSLVLSTGTKMPRTPL